MIRSLQIGSITEELLEPTKLSTLSCNVKGTLSGACLGLEGDEIVGSLESVLLTRGRVRRVDKDGDAIRPSVTGGHVERSFLVFNGREISSDAIASEELDALDEPETDGLVERAVPRRVLESGVDTGSVVDQEGNAHPASTTDRTEERCFVVEITSVDFGSTLQKQSETISVSTEGSFVEGCPSLGIT